jgi:hypothetical protein
LPALKPPACGANCCKLAAAASPTPLPAVCRRAYTCPAPPRPRFELKLVARGFACWRHTTAAGCAAEASSPCRWLGGGGGGGGGSGGDEEEEEPAAELWAGLGRPCVMDEAAQQRAVQEFYVRRRGDGAGPGLATAGPPGACWASCWAVVTACVPPVWLTPQPLLAAPLQAVVEVVQAWMLNQRAPAHFVPHHNAALPWQQGQAICPMRRGRDARSLRQGHSQLRVVRVDGL